MKYFWFVTIVFFCVTTNIIRVFPDVQKKEKEQQQTVCG